LIKIGENVFLKLENLNPTGSFKDRGASLAISWVKSKGYDLVIEDSSGNAGIAVAAYSAYANLRSRIYVPSDIPHGKYVMLRSLGAEVIKSGSRDDAHRAAITDSEGFYVGHTVNPFFIEGMKDIALELIKDVGNVPKTIIVPVASGTLILGLWKGFNELKQLGLINEVPRLISVQACGYSTLNGKVKTYFMECSIKSKLADALRLTLVPRLDQIINVLKDVNGVNVVVGDTAIVKSLKILWGKGLMVEPSSATVYAAYEYLRNIGEIEEPVILILTGSGLKYVDLIGDVLVK